MKRIAVTLAAAVLATAAQAEGQNHKIVFQIDAADPALYTLVLNNIENVVAAYEGMGDTVDIELVAFGPGLNMFVADKSPVEQRIAALSLAHPNVGFDACGNTIKGMTAKLGHAPKLIDEAEVVPAGVVRITELQEQGYAYIRP